MTARAYCRCSNGHYFAGEYCPFDGSSSPAAKELTQALERMTLLGGGDVSLARLRQAGLSETTLERVIVVEFGASESAFEAVAPQEYFVNGEAKPPKKLGRHFK
jgi:hypothetical protein